jgi:hypothetical protein
MAADYGRYFEDPDNTGLREALGEYLEDPHNPELHQVVLGPPVEGADTISDPGHLALGVPLEIMERIFLCALQDSGEDGLKSYIPCMDIDGGYLPLTKRNYDRLDRKAEDKVTVFPIGLVVNRLAWEKDEVVLPEKLCHKLMRLVRLDYDLPKALTISFEDAATLVSERLDLSSSLLNDLIDTATDHPEDPGFASVLELLKEIKDRGEPNQQQ